MQQNIIRIEDILEKVEEYKPNADFELIKRAYIYSAIAHKGQRRLEGTPYLQHPLAVAYILAEMHMDEKTIVAGLLHDVVEDTMITIDELQEIFDKEITDIINAVTKISEKSFNSKDEQQADYFRRMILGISQNIKVIMVKLADRLHNMRTLHFLPPEKAYEKAKETIDIFAPIAYRLGMSKLKSELQDLALPFIDPETYKELSLKIKEKEKKLQPFLEQTMEIIKNKMKENDIPCEVEGRIKRPYSIYDKMKRQNIPFEMVYDFIAFRIITDSVKNCYAALGLIHQLWTPIPGRIKDYIAIPKENFYQSLHTSVMTDAKIAFEVQIRTREMHEIAENGIAAHWLYKEGKTKIDPEITQQFMKQLYDSQMDIKDAKDFMKTLIDDLKPNEIYVLTPKGDVRAFPPNATPVDFAYSIHSDLGNTCVGAKVNGKIVPLNYILKNGDVVEIITQPHHHPSRDWLSFVVTARAKSKIKSWLNASEREAAIEMGKKILEHHLRHNKLNVTKFIKDEVLSKFYKDLGYSQLNDFLAAIGYSKVNINKVIKDIKKSILSPEIYQSNACIEEAKEKSEKIKSSSSLIKVKNADGLLISFARCCHPIKGEDIIGYITKGRGITIHSSKCPNIEKIKYNPDKIVEVEWDNYDQTPQTSHLIITSQDSIGMLAAISDKIAKNNVNIKCFKGEPSPDKTTHMKLTIEVYNIEQLEKIIQSIRSIKGVISVERAFK